MIRPLPLSIALALTLLAPAAHAAWPRNGLAIAPGSVSQTDPAIVSDGLGTFIVGWVSGGSASGVVRLQRRVRDGGLTFGWPDSGVRALTVRANLSLVPDGEGGVYVSGDPNALATAAMVSHFTSSGAQVQRWPLSMPVTNVPLAGDPEEEAASQDGWSPQVGAYATLMPVTSVAPQGAMIVAWMHSTFVSDHVHVATWTGNSEPPDGWPRYGVRVGTDGPVFPSACPDDSGGIYVGVVNIATSPRSIDVHHRTWDGSSATITTLPTGGAEADGVSLVPDGAGGAIVVWQARTTEAAESTYAQRVHHRIGVDPAWPSPSVRLSAQRSQAGTRRTLLATSVLASSVAGDGAGGAFVAWTDYRDAETGGTDIYLQHLASDGTLASGWPEGGLAICRAPGNQSLPRLVADAMGGVYVTWEDRRAGHADVYLQSVSATGTPNWPGDGYPVCDASGNQDGAVVAADGNGAILAWSDARVPVRNVYATRVALGDRVPALASLVRAEADPRSVRVEWRLGGDVPVEVAIERSEQGGAWRSLATAVPDADGTVRHEDLAVAPGARYGYRLRSGGEALGETWVEVPHALSFSLDPPWPNPATSGLTLVFDLPRGDPVRIEVMDLGGRRVLSQNSSAPRAGRHRVAVPGGDGLAPGVYVVRLTQGDRTLSRRFSIVR